jgi:hypothetical protein
MNQIGSAERKETIRTAIIIGGNGTMISEIVDIETPRGSSNASPKK